jgi:tRNA(fMet)-specific endonuclease VapC
MPIRAMLDTNIVSALMRAPNGPAQRRLATFGAEDVCISIIVLAELRFGFEKNPLAKSGRNLDRILGSIQVAPFEPPADEHYARLRAGLQKEGRPIGPNDLWIAAHALSLGLILVTANTREFSRVPGLMVENWLD